LISGAGGDAGAGGGDAGVTIPSGQGAHVPWIEQQAEDAKTNATVLAASRTKWSANDIQAEAIGRRAVSLLRTGDYVEFTTTTPANSIVVRYSIPDAPTGGGISATLGLYVNGTRVKSLELTSHYAWSYNGEYIPGAASDTAGAATLDDPSQPYPHTFFDEYNSGPGDGAENQPLIGEIPVGARVRLQRDAQDTASFYVIDLVDFEEAPAPIPMPAGFTSITDPSLGVNVKPNDGIDHADDLEKVLLSGVKKLYFPPGEYIVRKYSAYASNVALDNMGTEIAGAGMWYTRLLGRQAMFFCDVTTACSVHDLAIFGDSTARDEPVHGPQKAFAGPQGNGTQLYDLWIEHEVAGIWVGNDPDNQKSGPTQNLHIHDVRIRDTFADGINLDNGTSGTLVEDCHMRNTGDDAATVWAVDWPKCVVSGQCAPPANDPGEANDPGQGVGHDNTFDRISVQMPWRANCFAAYGGYGNTWKNSTCEDVLTYPGLFVDDEFGSYPFGSENVPAPSTAAAMTTFDNITLVRAGGEMFFEPNSTSCPASNPSCAGLQPWTYGAITLSLREGDVNDVLISNVTVVDPTYAGIELRGFSTAVAQAYGIAEPASILDAANAAKFTNVTLQNVTVTGAGTYGIVAQDLESGTRGTVTMNGVTVSASKQGAVATNSAAASLITKAGTANIGW